MGYRVRLPAQFADGIQGLLCFLGKGGDRCFLLLEGFLDFLVEPGQGFPLLTLGRRNCILQAL